MGDDEADAPQDGWEEEESAKARAEAWAGRGRLRRRGAAEDAAPPTRAVLACAARGSAGAGVQPGENAAKEDEDGDAAAMFMSIGGGRRQDAAANVLKKGWTLIL